MTSCVTVPLAALAALAVLAGTSKDSTAAAVATAVLGSLVGLLFFICALYFFFEGLAVFYRRVSTTKIGARAGLFAGIVCGALTAFLGATGCSAIWR